MKNKTLKFALLFLVATSSILTASACSSVVDGSMQEVYVETPGATTSVCHLDNGGSMYRVNPPEKIFITKSHLPVKVNCVASGNRNKTIEIEPILLKSTLFNVANGVIPGVAHDYYSGSMYKYPDNIIVDFRDMAVTSNKLPDYYSYDSIEPVKYGLEEFRPKVPTLSEDILRTEAKVEKRKPVKLQILSEDLEKLGNDGVLQSDNTEKKEKN